MGRPPRLPRIVRVESAASANAPPGLAIFSRRESGYYRQMYPWDSSEKSDPCYCIPLRVRKIRDRVGSGFCDERNQNVTPERKNTDPDLRTGGIRSPGNSGGGDLRQAQRINQRGDQVRWKPFKIPLISAKRTKRKPSWARIIGRLRLRCMSSECVYVVIGGTMRRIICRGRLWR